MPVPLQLSKEVIKLYIQTVQTQSVRTSATSIFFHWCQLSQLTPVNCLAETICWRKIFHIGNEHRWKFSPILLASACSSSTVCPQAALISFHSTGTLGSRPSRKLLMVPNWPLCLIKKQNKTKKTPTKSHCKWKEAGDYRWRCLTTMCLSYQMWKVALKTLVFFKRSSWIWQ